VAEAVAQAGLGVISSPDPAADLEVAPSAGLGAPISVGSRVASAAASAILQEADSKVRLWRSILATLQAPLCFSWNARAGNGY
jgi:hypothetical protein